MIAARVIGVFTRRRNDGELNEDIQAHLDLLTEEYLRRGLSDAAARDAARRAFGGVEQMKEVYRDQRGLPFLEHLLQDLSSAGRALRHSPGVTLVAVVTIALGVFGPTVTFTMAKAWILEPLPFDRPDDLIDLRSLDKTSGDTGSMNAADFLDFERSAGSFDRIAGYRQSEVRLTGRDRAERVRGAMVTTAFFQVLGTTAHVGRLFDPGASQEDQSTLVVISHTLWREQFDADPGAIGRTLRLNSEDYTVIGVLPESFQFTLLGRCDVWRPLVFSPEQAQDRRSGAMVGLARLRSGRTVEDARHELTEIAARLSSTYPETNARRSIRVLRLADEIRVHHDLGFIVPVMFAMVGCVLLIACINVTNVMLARASARRQEIALRLALGASRSRIVRQWLVEHLLLFVGASAIGAALAVYGAGWITESIPAENRQYLRNNAVLPVDRLVLLFAISVGAACGIVFGWFPAWAGTDTDVNADLRDGHTRSTPGRHATRLRAALVTGEVALALAVLISAGLLVTTARNITRVDVGFEPQRLLAFQLALDAQRYRTPAEMSGFYERLLADIGGRPGVVGAAAGSLVPFGTNGLSTEFFRDGFPEPPPASTPVVSLNHVTADYPRTLGLRLMRGRLLSAADGADAANTALISETLASRHFPNEDPLGQRFRIRRGETDVWTVVGVVADVKNFETIEVAEPQLYLSFAQQPRRAMTVIVRSTGNPDGVAAIARAAVAATDPTEPIADMASMDERIRRVTGPFQTISSFVTFFGAVTLLLAGVGVYGVIAYSFGQRTREIGIRMALGARRLDVAGLVLKQLRLFLLGGLLPGLLLAWALGYALKGMLFGVTVIDWRLYAAMTLLLTFVALLGTLVPTRRAIAIDPTKALRYE
jgi:putative ABC transport system permease protein